MCGIVGFVKEDSLKDLYKGLETLEYRGYDSVGVAYIEGEEIRVRKRKGRVDKLRAFLLGHHSDVCLGHTRWATHGAPSKVNAHPHLAGKFAVVHNGIIANYNSIKTVLENEGRKMVSSTDTEVIAHLLDRYIVGDDVVGAIRKTTKDLEGNWAVAALYQGTPDCVYLFKKGNPLIVGRGGDFGCFASDTPALVAFTREIYKMGDGEIARLARDKCTFWNGDGQEYEPTFSLTTLEADEVDKGAYSTYMEKEMDEIPAAIRKTQAGLEEKVPKALLREAEKVVFTGCGTAYHACLYGAGLGWRVPVEAIPASEFGLRGGEIDAKTVVVAVSQSGESADTLQAVKEAKARGAKVVGVTNVPQSGLTALVDAVMVTRAGAEIAVAATKSYVTQMLALRGLAEDWLGKPNVDALAGDMEVVRGQFGLLDEVAKSKIGNVFLLAKGDDYATCLEGALKIKEVAYLPCDTCYAGEIKHGPLACVDRRTLVVAVCTDARYADKMRTALSEVRTRGAKVLAVASSDIGERGERCVRLPQVAADMAPMLAVLPLQYLAYRLAVVRGKDPDKPRNLAKSVTVE